MSADSTIRPDAFDLTSGLRSSTAFSSLAGVVAAIVLVASDSDLTRFGLAGVGVVACGALVWASLRLRTARVPSWTSRQRDPFLAFAGSLGLLVAAQSTGELSGRSGSVHWGAFGSMVAAVAAMMASAGFLLMIRDLTPGRAIDALLLAAMVATAAGLLGWVAAAPQLRGAGASPGAWFLGSAALDLLTVALGVQLVHLRARARTTVALLLVAWTMVLSLDVARLLAHLTGESGSTAALAAVGIVVCGLCGAAALHPSAVQAAEPIVGPRARLPRSQVALLVAVVLLGPVVLTVSRASGVGRVGVLAVVVGLSLLVVVYLVRLVQGRAMLEHRAHHDELTGLANGTLFHERAAAAIDHARRTEGHAAVLFLDLDRFKNVNDSLGHGMGNMLLQAVAKRLRAATRAEDTVARIGGDEFVIFLPQIDDPSDAERVADEVLSRFKDPFVLAGHRLFASPSIGIAVFPDGGDGPDELLEHADTAMYRAKQRGRRTHCAFDPSMRKDAHQQLALENQLHGAIERGELCLHYQPKVHLPTGRMTGMEALLRWEHPEHGLLQPASFIALAEESGLIVPLGEWAMEEACRQNQAWNAAGFAPLVVAVNLSLRQFQLESVEDMTARVLRATGLDPNLLELELTESLAMQDPNAVIATLRGLKALGVLCSIDDFGTGYSGLSHLTGFPVDKLKIDKSFVATIDSDREAPIVVAVVALAHGLGLEVVAEGVETRAQLDRLTELGCDEMQGFLFSRPLPADRFEQLLMLESVAGGPGRLFDAQRGPLLTIAG